MSHFCVLVVTSSNNEDELDKKLMPFCEDTEDLPNSLLEFIEDSDCNINEKTGKKGYWENPKAKWDWWTIDGRYWSFLHSRGIKNPAQVKDVNFDATKQEIQNAKRFWEVIVEKQPLKDGEDGFFDIYKPEHYIKIYGDKENYIRMNSGLLPWAYIDKKGDWHEKGEMGWFGMSDESSESLNAYKKEFDEFVKSLDKNDWIYLVDCHI